MIRDRPARGRVGVVLKGYPRLSETFIAQEIRALEQRGIAITIFSLRRPTDDATHPVHGEIVAPVVYLPEYLYEAPARVLRGWRVARRLPGYRAARSEGGAAFWTLFNHIKSNDVEMTHSAIAIKEEVERLREQVQNVE